MANYQFLSNGNYTVKKPENCLFNHLYAMDAGCLSHTIQCRNATEISHLCICINLMFQISFEVWQNGFMLSTCHACKGL